MDKSVSQVLRWGMAGWCLVGELGLFFALYKLLLSGVQDGGTVGFSLLGGRVAALSDPGLMTVIFAALGIPLGYFIYQTYYFLFWTVPWSRESPPEAALIERLIGRCPRHKQLDDELNTLTAAWTASVVHKRFGRLVNSLVRVFRKFVLRRPSNRTSQSVVEFRGRWALTRAAWLRSLTGRREAANTGYSLAGDRFEYLTSMYDGLGAIMVANWGALAVGLAYTVWRLVYVDAPFATYTIARGDGLAAWEPPVWMALAGLWLLQCVIAWAVHSMIWTNRVLLRLSIVTLADAFICQFDCGQPGCRDEDEAKSRIPARDDDD